MGLCSDIPENATQQEPPTTDLDSWMDDLIWSYHNAKTGFTGEIRAVFDHHSFNEAEHGFNDEYHSMSIEVGGETHPITLRGCLRTLGSCSETAYTLARRRQISEILK
ncbi:hypothetical protein FQN50_004398 [Emmonsiellopsis sp. PD_5]|nr:hypothetical protein FQN50_004398 [Emmonsiellopsis sp. PD_5]